MEEILLGRPASPPGIVVTGVTTDSRNVRDGDLFVALPGTRHDGHDYVGEAVSRGAVAAVVSRVTPWEVPQVVVPDTLEALRRLARARRRELTIPVVAITGSCGKTTTKELTAAVLGVRFRVRYSQGNFNNEVGVPLSILTLEDGDEVLVLELGVSGPGEMAPIAEAASPTVAVVTNVAPTHLEFFRDVASVRREKMTLLYYLKPGGMAVLNADDALVSSMAAERVNGFKVITFGLTAGADVKPDAVVEEGFAGSRLRFGDVEMRVNLPGRYNVLNALAAVAVGRFFRLTDTEIAAGISSYRGLPLRSEVAVNGKGVTYFIDCYNSSPAAARAALSFVASVPVRGRRVAVLGDMLELGETSDAAHRGLGRRVHELAFDLLVGFGPGGSAIVEGAVAAGMRADAALAFNDRDEMTSFLTGVLKEGDVVLLKASRRLKLEEILSALGVMREKR